MQRNLKMLQAFTYLHAETIYQTNLLMNEKFANKKRAINLQEPVISFPGMFRKMKISPCMIIEGLQYGFGE